jgi:hypothetical protein
MLGAAVLGLSATACSQGSSSYSSTTALATALNDRGVACTDVSHVDAGPLAGDQATCSSHGSDLQLLIFKDEAKQATWVRVTEQIKPTAVGANWALLGEGATLSDAADALGASYSQP